MNSIFDDEEEEEEEIPIEKIIPPKNVPKQTSSIFNEEQEEEEEKEKSIGAQLAEEYEDLAELFKSGGKGFLEGIQKLGRIMGPLQVGIPEKQLQEDFTKALDELIPANKEEGLLHRGVRRGLKEFPTIAAFPGSGIQTLPRSILAGFLGETSKDLGAPEWAQTALEFTAFLGPDITKKLLETGSNKDIIKMARQFGLTDEQITPLIQSTFKQKWLSKLAPKRGRTQEVLRSTQKGLGEAENALKKSPLAASSISPESQKKLLNRFAEIAEDMPASVRDTVAQDFKDFVKNPITGKSLISLYRKVNKALGPKTKELVQFKEPILQAITEISPELGKQFSNINNLFSRYYEIAGKLKPSLVSDLVTAAETIGILGSTVLGDISTLSKILAEKGAKIGARELLLNPKINQLGEKFLLALNSNKYGLAHKIGNQINQEIKKLDDSIEIEGYTEKDLKEIFGS